MQHGDELDDVDAALDGVAEDEDHDGDEERRCDDQVLPLHRIQRVQPAGSGPGSRERFLYCIVINDNELLSPQIKG